MVEAKQELFRAEEEISRVTLNPTVVHTFGRGIAPHFAGLEQILERVTNLHPDSLLSLDSFLNHRHLKSGITELIGFIDQLQTSEVAQLVETTAGYRLAFTGGRTTPSLSKHPLSLSPSSPTIRAFLHTSNQLLNWFNFSQFIAPARSNQETQDIFPDKTTLNIQKIMDYKSWRGKFTNRLSLARTIYLIPDKETDKVKLILRP